MISTSQTTAYGFRRPSKFCVPGKFVHVCICKTPLNLEEENEMPGELSLNVRENHIATKHFRNSWILSRGIWDSPGLHRKAVWRGETLGVLWGKGVGRLH